MKMNPFYQDRNLSFYTLPIPEFFWPKRHGYNKYIWIRSAIFELQEEILKSLTTKREKVSVHVFP